MTEGEDGRRMLRLSCMVDLPVELTRKQPPLLCVGKYPNLGAATFDTGSLNAGAYQTTENNAGWHAIGPERTSWPIIVLLKGVPQSKTLVKLDGEIALIRQIGSRATGEWALPDDIGKSRKVGPATLKLTHSFESPLPENAGLTLAFEVLALEKDIQGAVPFGKAELLGDDKSVGAPTVLDAALQEIRTGPMPLPYILRHGKKRVKAIRIVVPELNYERVPMRIEKVEIPRSVTMAATSPTGPRGPREVQADGFTVVLDSVTLSAAREGGEVSQLALKISCRGPKKPNLVSFPFSILDLQAVTEAGERLALEGGEQGPGWTPTRYQSTEWSGQIHTSKTMPAPTKPADRFVTLTGRFAPLLFVEQWAETVVEIPADESRTKIEKAPLTLDLVRRENDLSITIHIAESGLPGAECGWWDAVKVGCRDASGQNFSKDVRCIKVHMDAPSFAVCQCRSPKGAVTVSVKYPVKGTKKDVPFEFRDVGLPRKAGTAQPENDEF